MEICILSIIAFFIGAIPFSLLIGKIFLKKDIRKVGDGNPGATNVLKSGGKITAFVSGLFDFLKGAIPVFIALNFFNYSNIRLFFISISSILGHAFSPFFEIQRWKSYRNFFRYMDSINKIQISCTLDS